MKSRTRLGVELNLIRAGTGHAQMLDVRSGH